MSESATNTGNVVGKIDQHMGDHTTDTGYKPMYVDVAKNKKLGIITRGNVNSVLYNLLWDIISHQVDNSTARGEMDEVNWLLKRFPKDADRDDDTGVSNETIHKYIEKARDIIKGMKQVTEEVYVEDGKITKRPKNSSSKKINEEKDEVYYPNGEKVPEGSPDIDKALSYMYGTDRDKDNSKYTIEEKQKAINYWIEKTDPSPYNEDMGEDKMKFVVTINTKVNDGSYEAYTEIVSGSDQIDAKNKVTKRLKSGDKVTSIRKATQKDLTVLGEELDRPVHIYESSDNIMDALSSWNDHEAIDNQYEKIIDLQKKAFDFFKKKELSTEDYLKVVNKRKEIEKDLGDRESDDHISEEKVSGMSYSEFIELAKQYYEKGGDSYVECWDEKEFDNYVSRHGGRMTKREALKMFKRNLSIENEYMQEETGGYNPFKDMIKSDSPEWHRGLYTDGNGSFYEAPRTGETRWIKSDGLKYRYNFGTSQIEVADNSGEVLEKSYLSLGSWLDDPQYWFERLRDTIEAEDNEFAEKYLVKDEQCSSEDEVNESSGIEFNSSQDLDKYVSGKDDIIIYYNNGKYIILDEEVNDCTEDLNKDIEDVVALLKENGIKVLEVRNKAKSIVVPKKDLETASGLNTNKDITIQSRV